MTMMIAGCTAKAEALPPYFQFQTKAETSDRKRIRFKVAKFTPDVQGKFTLAKVTATPATFGLKEKGEMDND